jgi:Fic family protein
MNSEKYGINGNTVYDKLTGSVIDLEEVKKAKERNAIETFHESMEELRELGLNPELVVIKYRNREYTCVDIKREFEFNKEFRVELREIMLSKELSKNARCFIGTLSPFVSFPSNAIHIKYKNPTFDELMDILDMSKNTLSATFKELEENDIIKKIKVNGDMVIFFNPFLFCGGYCVEKSTFDLFENSIYNPVK